MSDKFKQQLQNTRRNLIIDAAIVVISERGFQRTTIKQISAEAGIAAGTIYNYFDNKDAILLGIVERMTEAEVRDLHFDEALNIEFDQFVQFYLAHRMTEVEQQFQAMQVIIPETMINQELGERVFEQVYAPAFAIAEQFFAKMMAEEIIDSADPTITSRLFAAPLMGLLTLRLMGDPHVTEHWDDYAKAASNMLIKGFKKSD